MNVLVVDDDKEAASFIKYVLQAESYRVAVAHTVAEARRCFDEFHPGLIILDRGLPDADGLSWCQELRSRCETRAMPVLVLSAAKSVDAVVEGLNSGADDYMTKPFHFIELLARVDLLARRQAA